MAGAEGAGAQVPTAPGWEGVGQPRAHGGGHKAAVVSRSSGSHKAGVQELVDMGFPEAAAERNLFLAGGDVARAAELCLSGV